MTPTTDRPSTVTTPAMPVGIEITSIPPLAPGELSLIEMHTLFNMLNVLSGELMLIGLHLANDPDLLKESLATCDQIKSRLADPARALEFAAHVADEEQAILAAIVAVRVRHAVPPDDAEFNESVANIHSVFRILEVRAQEVLARAQAPDRWLDFPLEELRLDFHEVFAAIEKNSKGRYRIIYNLARQQPSDYYVDFAIESTNGRSIAMPLLFKDVMRDLIANARKYTLPGGTINVGLYETGAELRFVVQDTGRGIPAEEIPAVVHFGRRGSNVQQLRTMGGGFGLTKAFLVTKRFGGRMWIKSELGVGTRITLKLPRPGA
jgi:signal transduction histidine kinase